MIEQIKRFKPWLQTENNNNSANIGKCDGQTVIEFLQNPEELAKYEKLTTCISCGICESSCPVFAGGDAFINVWVFIIAPLVGGTLAALVYKAISENPEKEQPKVVDTKADIKNLKNKNNSKKK